MRAIQWRILIAIRKEENLQILKLSYLSNCSFEEVFDWFEIESKMEFDR